MQYYLSILLVFPAFFVGAYPICDLCSEDESLKPDESIPSEENKSCGDFDLDGKLGKISEEDCVNMQSSMGEFCCVPSSPTSTPPTLAPHLASGAKCSVCGDDMSVTLPDATFYYNATHKTVPCGFLQKNGLGGITGIPHEACPDLPALLKDDCGCAPVRLPSTIDDSPEYSNYLHPPKTSPTTTSQSSLQEEETNTSSRAASNAVGGIAIFVIVILMIVTVSTALVSWRGARKEALREQQTPNNNIISATMDEAENNGMATSGEMI